ncbi:hypothetical protein B7L70_02230 [Vulcanisaeta sp. EB80]|nr:hypothetical protein B7L70_02230 [Vulcanisaeta sp. EB80]
MALDEDKRYSLNDLRSMFQSQNISRECVKPVYDEFKNSIINIEPVIEYIRERFRIESPPPLVVNDHVHVGQWIIPFKWKCDQHEILIITKPKVGWDGFNKMVQEVVQLLETLRNLELVAFGLRNLLPNIEDYVIDLLYSPLVIKYTEAALSEPLPGIIEYRLIISQGQFGKVDVARTAALRLMGKPLIASKKATLIHALPPIIMLVRFHYKLLTRLMRLRELLSGVEDTDLRGLISSITSISRIDELIRSHRAILSIEPLAMYIDHALRVGIDDEEIISETERFSGGNTWLRTLAELYRAYIARLAGIKSLSWGSVLLVPTSKVFELWVLSLLLRAFDVNANNIEILHSEPGGVSIGLGNGNNVRIHYNITHRNDLIRQLTNQKILRRDGLRPDYVIELGRTRLVVDAKYKFKLDMSDVERMMAYIVGIAPQLSSDVKAIGMFIMLSNNDEPKIYRFISRGGLLGEVELWVIKVKPGNPDKSVASLKVAFHEVISRSLETHLNAFTKPFLM